PTSTYSTREFHGRPSSTARRSQIERCAAMPWVLRSSPMDWRRYTRRVFVDAHTGVLRIFLGAEVFIAPSPLTPPPLARWGRRYVGRLRRGTEPRPWRVQRADAQDARRPQGQRRAA